MQVDHDSAVPVWRQIAALIAGLITQPGQRLPSELTLCQELGVSRGSVRHAYRHLAEASPDKASAMALSRSAAACW